MKIAEQEIEKLKKEISLVRLVESRGVKLVGKGDNLIGLCPLHPDRKPSLVVSPSKNVWHCLGACKTGGSVIDWVMKADRVSFRLAVEKLRKSDPSLVAPWAVSGYQAQLEPVAEPGEPDDVMVLRTVDYYHRTLKSAPESHRYLETRGLHNTEMVDHFKIGYANRTLGYRLPDKRVSGGEMRGQLVRLGILRKTGHEHFAGCITVPIIGEDGRVMEIYGRKLIDGHARSDTPRHLYLPKQPHGRGVFNVAALAASKEIVLCEALFDALTFWCAGIRNVTSAYGAEGFTDEMRAALKRYGTTKLLVAYDRDEAGDRAAEALAKELGHSGLEIFRVRFPHGMDANELALKMQPASKSLELVLRSAEWMAGTRPVPVPEALEPSMLSPEPPQADALPYILGTPSPAPTSAAPLPPTATPPAAPSLLAAPATAPHDGFDVEERKDELRIDLGTRRWRVRGLSKNTSYESLRLNLLVAHGESFFVDTLELYSARQRGAYLKQAADELKLDELTLKSDLGRLVLMLEDRVHEQITEALAPVKKIEMSDEERTEALQLLRDPNLLSRILEDFDKAGVVGEETNKLVGYLATVSRKLEAPLAVILQSSSAAGKSSLMDAVLRFVPEEERVHYSAMTGQSLFYMGESDLSHKILAIAEEEGAQSASYALKLLQSEGELTIASTGKDPTSGKHVTHEYKVKGPVMIFLTTTAIEVDEELLNRCLVLTVDEGTKQTSAIHDRQRVAQTLEGLLARQDKDALLKQHQNAQRLLEPLFVINPLAKELRFSSHTTRARRDHMKYLTLIQAIALLHQHQRPIQEHEHRGKRVRYIEVTKGDIEMADKLAGVVLPQSLDELPPQTRRLLATIEDLVTARAKAQGIDRGAVRFTRREIREHARLSHTQIRVHVGRLEALEYLLVHGGGGKRRALYELATSAADGRAIYGYDVHLKGVMGPLKGVWRPLEGPPPLQENPSHSASNGDLEGANGSALIRSASKTTAKAYEPS